MKTKTILGLFAVAAFSLSLSACATVTRGTHDEFVVETDPAGAKVVTSNGYSCDKTPCSMKMPRKSEFEVTITKAGYKTWTGKVTNKQASGGSTAMAGNILIGGVVGLLVDSGNGSTLDLVPNPLIVTLEKEDAVESGASSGTGS